MAECIPFLARLRVRVFKEFPYLYAGDEAYEAQYLATYAESSTAIIVLAEAGTGLVGAATGTALVEHHDQFASAIARSALDPDSTFYCAESVLMDAWRGQGVGHRFFDVREAHARQLGYTHSCFCAVSRPEDHPLRPADYRPLDSFWRKRGYAPLDGVVAEYEWPEITESASQSHQLQFWARAL